MASALGKYAAVHTARPLEPAIASSERDEGHKADCELIQGRTGGEIRGPLTGHRVSPRPSSHENCAVQADKVFRVRLPHVGPEAFLDHGEHEVAPLR